MEFNSQICTTKIQSERLLALGLKKETADCIWCEVRTLTKGNPIQWYLLAEHINKHDEKHIPAWSLHRLIEMLPEVLAPSNDTDLEMPLNISTDSLVWTVEYDGAYETASVELIDALCDMVVRLKEEGVI